MFRTTTLLGLSPRTVGTATIWPQIHLFWYERRMQSPDLTPGNSSEVAFSLLSLLIIRENNTFHAARFSSPASAPGTGADRCLAAALGCPGTAPRAPARETAASTEPHAG